MDFNFVEIPPTLYKICSIRDVYAVKVKDYLYEIITSDKFLHSILLSILKEEYRGTSLSKYLSSNTYLTIRNQIASLYIYYLKYNHFPKNFDLSLLSSILQFEKNFQKLEMSTSRVFLFLFYLNLQDDYRKFTKNLKVIGEKIQQITNKTNELDIIIITYMHLGYFNDSFNTNLNKLTEEEKETFYTNLLTYFASINETSFILKRIV